MLDLARSDSWNKEASHVACCVLGFWPGETGDCLKLGKGFSTPGYHLAILCSFHQTFQMGHVLPCPAHAFWLMVQEPVTSSSAPEPPSSCCSEVTSCLKCGGSREKPEGTNNTKTLGECIFAGTSLAPLAPPKKKDRVWVP